MFKVKPKKGYGLVFTVYAVDDTGLWFLTYMNGNWEWINGHEYEPYVE